MVLWLPNVLTIHSHSYLAFLFPVSVTDENIFEVKTITCKAVFQFKYNLNVFKGVVIIYQEIATAFASFITTVKRTQ